MIYNIDEEEEKINLNGKLDAYETIMMQIKKGDTLKEIEMFIDTKIYRCKESLKELKNE